MLGHTSNGNADPQSQAAYSDIVFEFSVADPTAATFPALLQKFHHALYQHNVECEGSTILCRAASQGRVSLMETLLDKHHADVNAVHQGSTALIKAVMSGSLAAVEQVLSRKELLVICLLGDPRTQRHTKDKSGRAPVDVAKSRYDYDILCALSNCRHYCPAGMFAEAVILSPVLILLYLVAAVVKWALFRDTFWNEDNYLL